MTTIGTGAAGFVAARQADAVLSLDDVVSQTLRVDERLLSR